MASVVSLPRNDITTQSLSDGASSPYVATILGNLRHWLDDDQQISELIERLPLINRENICKR
jgi:ArsR family transcriptional regulator